MSEITSHLLAHCSQGTAGPVEIEFAGNLAEGGRKPEFGFLQLRPLALSTESEEVRIGEVGNVNVVPDGGAVWRWVVRPEHS